MQTRQALPARHKHLGEGFLDKEAYVLYKKKFGPIFECPLNQTYARDGRQGEHPLIGEKI